MKLLGQASESRLCTLLIGAIQAAWAVLPVTGGDWRFTKILRHYHQTDEWLWWMLLLGCSMMVSAVCPLRKLRQISLFLSSATWFASFGMWLNYWVNTGAWLVSPTTMLFPVLGIFCVLLLANDIEQRRV